MQDEEPLRKRPRNEAQDEALADAADRTKDQEVVGWKCRCKSTRSAAGSVSPSQRVRRSTSGGCELGAPRGRIGLGPWWRRAPGALRDGRPRSPVAA
eukprot:1770422-Heterocapsa_arctica.AAC.1